MFNARNIVDLHTQTVARWHDHPVANPYTGLMSLVCRQHAFNFELWHQEDIARCPESSDQHIAQVKRAIDGLNQNRNDWIEKIDDWISQYLVENQIETSADARRNTETCGSAIDRLSILAIRLFHLQEQLDRDDVEEDHMNSVQKKIDRCLEQLADLGGSLQQLCDDIVGGQVKHHTYRQFKMYNDPTLNPYLYSAGKAA